ncbi:tetratricopeptide repeat protein [Rhodopseudomonas palustris]|jgi:hypothetical protein|uniref:tetratricopeptide repeat protein n=1 Tax=Rhodopseudomonas palustris TaxID=1076 RepID=UPI0020CFA6C3|nr:tetratricopeptide repeat protein [Rhodopseudomonas palustris]MCP9625842.1 tetratricopeptide repeat protein [Rhodopseudomonas palustris]
MPFAVIVVLLDVMLVYHASRTGRLQPWAFIILMIPVAGAVAYVLVELLPEILGGPQARRAGRRVINRLDPEKEYRNLSDRLAATDTIANRAALANECLALGRFEEAEQHYTHLMALPHGDDPAYAIGKAKAEFGLKRPADAVATLDAMREAAPDYESAEGHLLYARALAEAGRTDEALQEFEAVSQYFPGAEARVRHGLLLEELGRAPEAKAIFMELLIQMKRAPKFARKVQAEWITIAEKRIAN